ncbi:MAG TPA: aconitase family protein [Myxococcales bacterium]|nr:aconitase family protein [Myxococcales bacterium]
MSPEQPQPTSRKPMTLTQKILAHHARGLTRPWVQAGDILQVRVDWTIASELAWNGMDRTYQALGRPKIHDPDRFFLAVDHTVDPVTLAGDKRAQKLTQLSRDFAAEAKLRHFYDANVTILHTKFYRDLVQPGQVVLGADSHTSSHGGMGAFSIGLGGADITAAMVLGQSWLEVPEAIAVEYQGSLPFGFGGKDVILQTLGALRRNTVAMERSVEYRGDAVRHFSTDTRFTIANMTAEFGGLNGIFEADEVVADWLSRRPTDNADALYFRADPDAPYVARYPIDLGQLVPFVAKPFSPDNILPITEALGMPLHGCFIGACTTTEEELVLGALVLELAMKDRPPQPASPKKLVVPGDLSIQANLKRAGLWDLYERAGFRVGPPGCSMCLGVASEKALPGEVWLSSQNRNYENRMGQGSLAWLASAATVAASAVEMKVTDPRPFLARIDQDRFARLLHRAPHRLPDVRASEPEVHVAAATGPAATASAAAASATLRGRVQRFGDNIDTDAIIPGEFCHLTKLEELGQHAFHHVRPEFHARAQGGRTLVVAGAGWGSGSSREQAVWALSGAGIQAVVARSFAFIHKRNLVNDALPYLVVTDPDFYQLAQEDAELSIDLAAGTVTHAATGRAFKAERPSPIVQALQREGGLVPAIRHHGSQVFDALGGSA